MNILIKKLNENAKIPTKGSEYSAGYDLYSTETVELKLNERHLFLTNISIVIPVGYYGRIAPRSGLAYKNGINVLAGIIDCDYRNNIGVILINHGDSNVLINNGDRIAQLIIQPYYDLNFIEIDDLPKTDRGLGGFGSTGK